MEFHRFQRQADRFEIDLAEDLCKRMKAKCEIVAQAFDGVIPPSTRASSTPIMAGMNITDKRKEAIAFTSLRPDPVDLCGAEIQSAGQAAGSGQGLFAQCRRRGRRREIAQRLQALLKGKIIGVQTSTAQANFLEKYFKDVIEIRQYKTTEQHDLDLPPAASTRCSGRSPISRAWSRRRKTRK